MNCKFCCVSCLTWKKDPKIFQQIGLVKYWVNEIKSLKHNFDRHLHFSISVMFYPFWKYSRSFPFISIILSRRLKIILRLFSFSFFCITFTGEANSTWKSPARALGFRTKWEKRRKNPPTVGISVQGSRWDSSRLGRSDAWTEAAQRGGSSKR